MNKPLRFRAARGRQRFYPEANHPRERTVRSLFRTGKQGEDCVRCGIEQPDTLSMGGAEGLIDVGRKEVNGAAAMLGGAAGVEGKRWRRRGRVEGDLFVERLRNGRERAPGAWRWGGRVGGVAFKPRLEVREAVGLPCEKAREKCGESMKVVWSKGEKLVDPVLTALGGDEVGGGYGFRAWIGVIWSL